MAEAGKNKKSPDAELLPSPEEAHAAYTAALGEDTAPLRDRFHELMVQPPQLLHLEGGTTEQRAAMALYWAALHNCDMASAQPQNAAELPCLDCPSCLKIGAGMHPDILLFDGRSGSIKIDDMRALKPVMGDAPHFARKRVVILLEAQFLTIEAANSLLKILEEPSAFTLFVFTVPQRERLLPTLVSRGFVLTLPWPDPRRPFLAEEEEWASELAGFLSKGTGWFAKSSARGTVTADIARMVLALVQRALILRMAEENPHPHPLMKMMKRIPDAQLPVVDDILSRSQEALNFMVNPSYVLDSMASSLFACTRSA